MIVYTLVAWGTIIFLCIPVTATWDTDIARLATTKCYSLAAFTDIGLMNTGINILTDVLLATLPAPIIWKLQLDMQSRLALIGVLSLGYVAVALGIARSLSQINFASELADQTLYVTTLLFLRCVSSTCLFHDQPPRLSFCGLADRCAFQLPKHPILEFRPAQHLDNSSLYTRSSTPVRLLRRSYIFTHPQSHANHGKYAFGIHQTRRLNTRTEYHR